MDKAAAVKRAGSMSKLAVILGITRQAVSGWGRKVPGLRLYQLRERRPDWFRKTKSVAKE